MIPTNWRRGLLRLWIAASVVWLVATLAAFDYVGEYGDFGMFAGIFADVGVLMMTDAEMLAISDSYGAATSTDGAATSTDKAAVADGIEQMHEMAPRNLAVAASVILLPPIVLPIVLFVLGRAGLWIARGFRS